MQITLTEEYLKISFPALAVYNIFLLNNNNKLKKNFSNTNKNKINK